MTIKSRSRRQELTMLVPAFVFLFLIIVVPFSLSIWFSFTDQRLVPRPIPTRFVGLTNYERMFSDSLFWQALRNTAFFAAMVVPFQLAVSLTVAMALNAAIPFRDFFRSISILPLLLPMTVVVAIWGVIYRVPNGALNSVVHLFVEGDKYVDFIGSPSTAMVALVVLSAWASFPYQMLIYLAGLQEIPKELYEASKLDGAKRWDRFRFVTWPGLRNVNVFLLIITTIQALKLFTQVSVMTKGGPNNSTTTIIYYLFQQGFSGQKIGYASAIAVFFFLTVTTFALLQRVLLKNEGEA